MPKVSRPPCSVAGCDRPNHAFELCQTHYKAWERKRGKCKVDGCPSVQMTGGYCRPHERLLIERLGEDRLRAELDQIAAMVTVHKVTGCWLWNGELNSDGYARKSIGGHKWLLHRFMFVTFFGSQRNNWQLDHLCNVPRCIRPNHLLSVTKLQNDKNKAWRKAHPDFPYWKHDAYTRTPSIELLLWAGPHGLPVAPSSWRVEQR